MDDVFQDEEKLNKAETEVKKLENLIQISEVEL